MVPYMVTINPDQNMKIDLHSWVRALKYISHLGKQMSHLPVQTKLDSLFKPAILRSETSTASESCIDE
jgi:hypothetical protein